MNEETAASKRWPARVYAVGEEPDPRFSLANERTFLAWLRTSLALVGAGVALEALALPLEPTLRFIASVLLLLMGMAAPVQAWLGWCRDERAMRLRQPLPAPTLVTPLSVGAVAVAGCVLAGLLAR